MELARHDHRVDDVAAVIDRACLRVNLDHANVGPERPDEVRRIEIGDGFESLLHARRQLAVSGKGNLTERLGLVGRAFDMKLAVVENDVLLSRLEKMRRDLLALVDDLVARMKDGDATHRQRAGSVGAVAEAW